MIAATNRPLEQAVANRHFREDLFYRLNVVRIEVPPLRDRREDIRLLVNYFLKKFAQHQKQGLKSISPSALGALEQYSWPGNVRELENIIQRALVVAKGEVIVLTDLPTEVLTNRPALGAGFPPAQESAGGVPSTTPSAAASDIASADLPALARSLFQWARKESHLKILPAVERELIIEALKETRGNQVQAAKLLGITRATLRKRVEKFKIHQELAIK